MQTLIKLLPDGSGKVRLHYFVHDDKGPIKTPTGTVMTALGPVTMGGVMGYVACQPRRTEITPEIRQNVVVPVPHTNEARAVTCPECKETVAWKETMKLLEDLVETR
jgi:hypothetical protein